MPLFPPPSNPASLVFKSDIFKTKMFFFAWKTSGKTCLKESKLKILTF